MSPSAVPHAAATADGTVAAFYRFAPLTDLPGLRAALLEQGRLLGVKGSILLAPEGVNGSLAGPRDRVAAMLECLCQRAGLDQLSARHDPVHDIPFRRFKVKLKREIVTLGIAELSPPPQSGRRVGPREWDALLRAPQVLVIDTRNDYEYRIGSFAGAVNPQTAHFRDFPRFVAAQLGDQRARPIAMFCTGGIRCEKASAYLLGQGFERVFQLDGGILRYLAETDPADSAWRGDCFVFDERVAVDHALNAAGYEQCPACRRPVAPSARGLPGYEAGVSCAACHAGLPAGRRRTLRERARQVRLAAARGESHLGAVMAVDD
ncbi:MAG: rhodanese-related sulfurtransferase [Gammaproteobacteria bacterium]|nr:rhodanese-related sulfurtransferase [Gammaproteobacteria bacterium]